MTELVGLLRDFGFPVFVAVFVLVRIEPAIRGLTDTLSKMSGIIEKCGK